MSQTINSSPCPTDDCQDCSLLEVQEDRNGLRYYICHKSSNSFSEQRKGESNR